MDPNDRHNDPLHEASDKAGQRLVQLTTLIATFRQLVVQRNLRRNLESQARDEAQRRAVEQRQRLEHASARARWAAAYDKRWLQQADVLDTARAWSAGILYAETDDEAAGAVRRCEERMRHLHPAAMRHYDQLRSEGLHPAEAMARTAPRFASHPDPYAGKPGRFRPALGVPASDSADDLGGLWLQDYPEGTLPSKEEFLDQRDRATAEDLAKRFQDEATATGREPLPPEEVRALLDARTNLPTDAIADAVPMPTRVTLHPASPDDAPALAAADFPISLDDVLGTPAANLPQTQAQPTSIPQNTRAQRPHLGK